MYLSGYNELFIFVVEKSLPKKVTFMYEQDGQLWAIQNVLRKFVWLWGEDVGPGMSAVEVCQWRFKWQRMPCLIWAGRPGYLVVG